MGENKVTTMVLKVDDLNCEKCRKKVKKILCKIPQIQDQVWDEKNNTVTIKVVCCSPEKIREKIICKGCGSITCIEIVVPKKPEKKPEEPKKKPKEPKKPACHNHVNLAIHCHSCQPCPAPPCQIKPIRVCCSDCYNGVPGGPCFCGHGYGPPSCYQCGSYGGGRGFSGCGNYLSEENPQGCSVM